MQRFALIAGAAIALLNVTACSVLAFEPAACEIKLNCAIQSVVSVLPQWPANYSRSEEPEGSGVVLGDGSLIATADHVIGPAQKIFVRTTDGHVVEASIVMRDSETDVAFLKLAKQLQPFSIVQTVSMGNRVCAIGNSFGLDLSLTCGVVSATRVSGVGFNAIEDFLQTDTAVNPGMSGGALVDENGELVGMLSAIFTKKSDSNIGVNFAVSGALLQRILEDFSDDGELSRINSGLIIRPSLSPGKTGIMGAHIVRVDPGSNEAKAGVMVDDVLVSFDGHRIKRAGAYRAALALTKKGTRVRLEIMRAGVPQILFVQYD